MILDFGISSPCEPSPDGGVNTGRGGSKRWGAGVCLVPRTVYSKRPLPRFVRVARQLSEARVSGDVVLPVDMDAS